MARDRELLDPDRSLDLGSKSPSSRSHSGQAIFAFSAILSGRCSNDETESNIGRSHLGIFAETPEV